MVCVIHMIHPNLSISRAMDLIKSGEVDIVPANIAKSEYGIVFGIGQEYNIDICRLLVLINKSTKQIAGYIYKKTYCYARWCIAWEYYQQALVNR